MADKNFFSLGGLQQPGPHNFYSRPHFVSTVEVYDTELGGRQGKLPVTAFEAFDLEVKSWTRFPSIPSRRAFASCAMADKNFFSLGGLQQPGPHNFYSRPHFVSTVEVYDTELGGRQGKLPVTAFEAFDLEVKSWTRFPSIPSRRAFASCAMVDKTFFSLGGSSSRDLTISTRALTSSAPLRCMTQSWVSNSMA
ncbi:UNVERIFIED_CONTAM: hypothetical protein FKN15_070945 [Acipenser sinensis]